MYYFIVLKILISIGILLIIFGKVKSDGPIYTILDTVFKVSLGIYIILFFGYNKVPGVNPHDRLLLIVSGFVLLITINYKEAFYIVTGQSKENIGGSTTEPVHVVTKPCPPCSEKDKIHGRPMFL